MLAEVPIPEVYLQREIHDCGVAVPYTLLSLFHKEHLYDDLIGILKTNPDDGTSSHNIVAFFQNLGIKTQIHKNSSIRDLRMKVSERNKICVVMYQNWDEGEEQDSELNYGHFSIVRGMDSKVIALADPAMDKDLGHGVGRVMFDADQFDKAWKDKEGDKIFERSFISISR